MKWRSEMESYREIIDEIVRMNEEEYCFRVEAGERERGFVEEAGDSCVEEVERVMMKFYQKGEFAFGSFWGRGGEAIVHTKDQTHTDDDFGRYQIIDMLGSFSYT